MKVRAMVLMLIIIIINISMDKEIANIIMRIIISIGEDMRVGMLFRGIIMRGVELGGKLIEMVALYMKTCIVITMINTSIQIHIKHTTDINNKHSTIINNIQQNNNKNTIQSKIIPNISITTKNNINKTNRDSMSSNMSKLNKNNQNISRRIIVTDKNTLHLLMHSTAD